jgi:hypothetical protein
MAMGSPNHHRRGLLDTSSHCKKDTCGSHGQVVHVQHVPKHLFCHLCPRMQQRTRLHLWRIFRGNKGSKRIQRHAAWANGHSSYPSQRQQTQPPTAGERGNRVGLPRRPQKGYVTPVAQDPIAVPPLGHPQNYPSTLSRAILHNILLAHQSPPR